MWNHFTRVLETPDGAPIYCDSCHQGTMTPLLDRHVKKALSQWMDENFVHGLKRRDGKQHDCATCHGEPFRSEFLRSWAGANPTSK